MLDGRATRPSSCGFWLGLRGSPQGLYFLATWVCPVPFVPTIADAPTSEGIPEPPVIPRIFEQLGLCVLALLVHIECAGGPFKKTEPTDVRLPLLDGFAAPAAPVFPARFYFGFAVTVVAHGFTPLAFR